MYKLSVVVPAHNESENLTILIPRLYPAMKGMGQDFEIVMVDNASTDTTAKVIREFQKTMPELRLVSEPTMGYGRAVLTGLANTTGSYIGIIRSDNQEKSEDLCEIFKRAQAGHYALYKAVRGHRIRDGLKRVIISFFYNSLFKLMFFVRSHDLNATPKVFTRDFYERAHLQSKDWFIDAEIVLKAEGLHYEVGEMEIEYLPRLKGTSNVRFRHIVEFLRNMLQWRLRLYGEFLAK
jgi:dolichol-phosphate mannosyltransferase